jgi:hypothetical protein
MINWKGDKESLTIPEMVCRLNKSEQSMHSRPALTEGERIVNYIKQVRGLERKVIRLQAKKPTFELTKDLRIAHDDLSALRRENLELRSTIKDDQQVNDLLKEKNDAILESLIIKNNTLKENLKIACCTNQTIWQKITSFWSNK